tara:strand:+ start:1086 stop:1409 length:324 start_codon:yes stop_codon:yes gene_type:complete
MKKLIPLALLLLLALISCRPEYVPTKYKYTLGDKVLLKTGDSAVIVNHHWSTNKHIKGTWIAPKYIIRVGYVKTEHHTDSFLDGHRVREREITKFTVYEHEIEKKIK